MIALFSWLIRGTLCALPRFHLCSNYACLSPGLLRRLTCQTPAFFLSPFCGDLKCIVGQRLAPVEAAYIRGQCACFLSRGRAIPACKIWSPLRFRCCGSALERLANRTYELLYSSLSTRGLKTNLYLSSDKMRDARDLCLKTRARLCSLLTTTTPFVSNCV